MLVLGDPAKPEAETIAGDLVAHLEGRVEMLGVELARTYEPITEKPDLVLVIGGDGSILAASHRLGRRRVPILGVNVGAVGFLAAVRPERVLDVLDLVLAGEGVVEDRGMLGFQVVRDGKTVLDSHVLNEIVVARAPDSTLCEVDLVDEGRWVCTYRGDGLIVSTATGSTAYNLAAGGPILSPRLDAVVLCPLAPYALSMRPLVLPGDRRFTLKVRKAGTLTADGHLEGRVRPEDRVRIGPSRRRLELVVDPKSRFYARLRSKLRWAEQPGPG